MKRLKKARELIKGKEVYTLDEALKVFKRYKESGHSTKFDETMDVTLKLGVDPRHSDQMIRGVISMPNGLGKDVRVAVFTNADRVSEAKDAGADVYGSEDLIDKVKAGQFNFDVCIATPDMMPTLGKIGKLLGPKGLMPNPKLGTVSNDIAEAVKKAKYGQVEYKTEKAGIIHAGVGKLSFEVDKLKENIMALYKVVLAAKPSGLKGTYMKGFHLSSSMGVSVEIDLTGL